MKRTLSILLALCMLLSLLPATLSTASASAKDPEPRVLTEEDYAVVDEVWAEIRQLEAELAEQNPSRQQRIDAVIDLVIDSVNYVEGSLEVGDENMTWNTDEGIACMYTFDAEERQGDESNKDALVQEDYSFYNYQKKGYPKGIDVYLMGPWYAYDSSFNSTYGVGSYESFGQKIAQATGGTLTVYRNKNVTIDVVADCIEKGAFVMIDSHGTYSYQSGRYRNYLRLSTGTGLTDADYANGNAYYESGYSHGAAYMVTGTAIANHMEKNAPNSFVWLGICSGMRYECMYKPLMERGVEALFGYSRTISFEFDRYWLSAFCNALIEGKDVAGAAAAMKSKYGYWDRNNETAYNTYTKAVNNGKAFPIFASKEDVYPNSDTQVYDPQSLQNYQTVKSTWRLVCPHTEGSTYTPAVDATCTATGAKAHYSCNTCGAAFADSAMTSMIAQSNIVTSALGHSYSSGICTRCGYVSGITLKHFWANSQEAKFSWTHENATASGIDTTDSGVIYSTSNGNDHYFHMASGTGSIGHTVNSGDVIEIRYRTTNVPSSLRNTTQSFEFWYTTTSSDSSFSSSMVLKANATVQEGTWQTVQFTPSSGITLKRIMFDFLQESKGFSGTKLEIDYMYIGPSARRPSQNAKNTILFDYTNKFTDELRYAGTVYNDRNYDSGNWAGTGIGTVSYNGTDMVVPVTSGATSFSVKTTDGKLNASSTPLSYVPAAKDMIQVRVKMNNLQAVAGKNAKLVASYIKNNGTAATCELATLNASNFDGEYFTVTAYLDEAFTGASVINALGIGFENVTNISGKSGSVSVDYIAVGQLSSLPVPTVPCTITFMDENGNVLESQSATVGGSVSYSGATPTKAFDTANHYAFAGWKTAEGTVADLNKLSGDLAVYPSFTAQAHSYTEEVIASAGCTATGLIRYNCSGCEYSYVGDPIPATGHTVVTDPGYAATCVAPGLSDGSHCSVCNTVLVAQNVIPAKGHTEVVVPGYAAGCLSSGMSDGISCSVCQTVIQAQQPIARLGHEYKYTDNGDGTHDGVCIRCDKTQSGKAHTVTDGVCTLCGNGGVVAPEIDEAIVIRHTLNLASDISINYAVEAKLLSDYDSFYLSCILPVYEGNTFTGTTSVEIQPVLNGSYYYFTLNGLTAVQVNNMIDATLIMTKDQKNYVSNVDSYSIATYAYAQLGKTSASKALKELCVELLRYSAKAQIYKAYRTDALADSALTAEQNALLSDLDSVVFGNTNSVGTELSSPAIVWEGKSLTLNSKVTLKFIFSAKNFTGNIANLTLRVSYKDIYGNTVTKTVSGPQVYNESKGFYAFDFDSLLASELRSAVSVVVYNGNTQVSNTMVYSADTYGNGKTGTLLTLCKALIAYSDSAKTFFANN